MTDYGDKYNKFISQRPLSEEMREKCLAWNQNPALFWECVESNLPTGRPLLQRSGYGVFWLSAYSPDHHHRLSPQLVCDIGRVDLNLDVRRVPLASGNTGSWLDDVFSHQYNWKQHKLPEETIGEFVRHVTETAALNGARYTRGALDEFIFSLENIGNVEHEIVKWLFIEAIAEAIPEEIFTLNNENAILEKIKKRAEQSFSSQRRAARARQVVKDSIGKGDIKKARRVAASVLRELEMRQWRLASCFWINSRPFLTAPRSSSRSRRPSVRSAAKSGGGDSGDSDSDGPGDPPGPRLAVPPPHNPSTTPPTLHQGNNSRLSRTTHPCRWPMESGVEPCC